MKLPSSQSTPPHQDSQIAYFAYGIRPIRPVRPVRPCPAALLALAGCWLGCGILPDDPTSLDDAFQGVEMHCLNEGAGGDGVDDSGDGGQQNYWYIPGEATGFAVAEPFVPARMEICLVADDVETGGGFDPVQDFEGPAYSSEVNDIIRGLCSEKCVEKNRANIDPSVSPVCEDAYWSGLQPDQFWNEEDYNCSPTDFLNGCGSSAAT